MNESAAFLNHLFSRVGGYLELTMIAPKERDLFPAVFTESYKIGVNRIDFDRVADFNRRGYGCYFGVTSKRNPPGPGRRASEDGALWLTALWADVDLKAGEYETVDDIQDALSKMHQTPTAVILSGGGVHAYWKIIPILINRNNRDYIKRILQGLAKAIKGDSVWDLSRVMRLPGTVNTKEGRGAAVCTIVHYTHYHYVLNDLANYAELVAPPKRKPANPADLPPQTIPGYLK